MPLRNGDSVCLIDPSKGMVDAFAGEPVETIILPEFDPELLDSSGVNHLVFVRIPRRDAHLLSGVVRVLRPGGTMLLVVSPMHRRTMEKNIRQIGMRILHVYGAWRNMESPEYLVPLENRAATRYFFQSISSPGSFQGEIFRRAAGFMANLGLAQFLFPEIAIVAEKA